MSKGRYRAVDVKSVNWETLSDRVRGKRVVVGMDAGKQEYRASLTVGSEEVVETLKWPHPSGSLEAVDRLVSLPASRLEVALEPTGSYSDTVRALLLECGVAVYRVSPKRVHDAREVYDGAPSSHDSKSAGIVAKLHWEGRSEPWPLRSDDERELVAAVRMMEVFAQQARNNLNRLEARLSRYWPELLETLELGTPTQLALLESYGSPRAVARDPEGARDCLRRASRGNLKPEKVAAVLAGAGASVGIVPVAVEREVLAELVAEIRRNQQLQRRAEQKIEALVADHEAVQHLAPVLSTTTAAVLVAEVGDPRRYRDAASYVKAQGLNLVEESSGTHRGQLKISKRGSGRARQWLYLAVLRLIQKDAVVRAWYDAKVARDGGKVKSKAVVAVMRKLSRALWHLAHGARFDSRRLFDTARLGLT